METNKRFKEFVDGEADPAVAQLNKHTEKYPTTKVVGYQISRYENFNQDRAYILVEYEEDE
ncbi:hypothetical protein BU583_01510 [Staphylococcus agnetis]|uniref:hypothetical protein n=1 Tax=Staphylococcus agnetis TaxID=985762 RepID=UPI000D1A6612|nr:hypothetical protein [Staphylococcus agnetis]PTH63919.1 hypothetical protein BU583_01225 [Staphylococcus agnetis]PTH63973.1 hypothetical protein BU583_01510 [Staphylococcus agnetis]